MNKPILQTHRSSRICTIRRALELAALSARTSQRRRSPNPDQSPPANTPAAPQAIHALPALWLRCRVHSLAGPHLADCLALLLRDPPHGRNHTRVGPDLDDSVNLAQRACRRRQRLGAFVINIVGCCRSATLGAAPAVAALFGSLAQSLLRDDQVDLAAAQDSLDRQARKELDRGREKCADGVGGGGEDWVDAEIVAEDKRGGRGEEGRQDGMEERRPDKCWWASPGAKGLETGQDGACRRDSRRDYKSVSGALGLGVKEGAWVAETYRVRTMSSGARTSPATAAAAILIVKLASGLGLSMMSSPPTPAPMADKPGSGRFSTVASMPLVQASMVRCSNPYKKLT